VTVVTIVEDARALAGADDVVGAHGLRGAGLMSTAAGADSLTPVATVAAVILVGASGSDAASRMASRTETAMGARLRNVSSQRRSREGSDQIIGGTDAYHLPRPLIKSTARPPC
jgi:hypothetical protein